MDPLITQLCERARNDDPRLRHVSLRSLPLLEVTDEEMYAVVESLEHNTHVNTFDMSIYHDADAAEDAEEHEIDGPLLTSISTPPPPPPFEQIFSQNSSLIDVRISSSSSHILSTVFRGLAVNKSVQTLQVGEVSATGETTLMSKECAKELKNMLEHNITIRRLALQGFRWEEDALKFVAAGLRVNVSLRVLELLQIDTTASISLASLADKTWVEPTNLMASIGAMKNLKRLCIISCDMSDMYFSYGTDGVDIISNSTRQHHEKPQLEELRLVECELTGPSIYSMQMSLKNNPYLRVLDVRGNSLEDDSCEALGEIINTAESLFKVILEDNNIGDEGLEALCHKGLAQNKSLKRLCLKDNNFGPTGVQVLADTLQFNNCLEELDLSYNVIGDAGALALAGMLQCNHTLSELVLENALLGGLGVAALCNGLICNHSIKKLNLSGNNFGPTGVKSLSKLLGESNELDSLRLANCQLGDTGVAALAKALELNSGLDEIVLPFNRFGDDGAAAIGSSLPQWKALLSLQIQFNLFSEKGFERIIEGLSYNFILKSMYLLNAGPSNNSIDEMFQRMQYYLRLNRGGRRAVNDSPPRGLWPTVLARANKVYSSDGVFFLLRERPDIIASRNLSS